MSKSAPGGHFFMDNTKKTKKLTFFQHPALPVLSCHQYPSRIGTLQP